MLRGLVRFVSFVWLYPGVDMCAVCVWEGVPAVLPRLRNKQTNKHVRSMNGFGIIVTPNPCFSEIDRSMNLKKVCLSAVTKAFAYSQLSSNCPLERMTSSMLSARQHY